MKVSLSNQAGDDAYGRYISSLTQIENIRQGIYNNRKGIIPLSGITENPLRLQKRIERETDLNSDKALERINGVANFQDVGIVKKISRMGDAICRVEIPMSFGGTEYGTGFLIAPNIMITNHHVFPSADDARNAIVKFRYELDENLHPSRDVSFRLLPDTFFLTSDIQKQPDVPFSGLDFSLVAVEDVSTEGIPLSQFNYVKLDGGPGKIVEGENCIVIQHPQGDYKKIVLKDIRLLTSTTNFLIYESDTLPGSSGSMVLGLGTGEVVALHHSGVPRKNAAGQWLRKDGSVADVNNDSDNVIDWLGNEGIRVNSILDAISGTTLPPGMETIKQNLLKLHIMPLDSPLYDKTLDTAKPSETSSKPSETSKPVNMNESAFAAAVDTVPAAPAAPVQYFEIILSAQPEMIQSWNADNETLIPGLLTTEQLFPFSTDDEMRRYMYISMNSDMDPWKQAAAIENLPQVEKCMPDLPAGTNMEPPAPATVRTAESAIFGGVKDDEQTNWSDFIGAWTKSEWCGDAIKNNKPEEYRKWSWQAVNAYGAYADTANTVTDDTIKNLSMLKMFQLDTGYSDLSKNTGGYDLDHDYDTVDDDDDAHDLESGRPGRFPDHGTRTASLVIGGSLLVNTENCDGNNGILTKDGKPLIKLIPYRISNSVILIGRGHDMVDGARRAISNGADVMFMCMGSYPRPMFEAIAYDAYQKGVIWVCAAGNQVKVVIAPAMYPGTVAVAGINPNFRPWSGSCRGPEVDVAAPGESVYVPFFKEDGTTEIMRFGSGTSYATPHVASAAMLWKAKHLAVLRTMYPEPWQTVEAFRYCLQQSVRQFPADGSWSDWEKKNYGVGLLDIKKLLGMPLPDKSLLKNAYDGYVRQSWDLGVIEAVAKIWNALWLNVTDQESALSEPLTERGIAAVNAFAGKRGRGGLLESSVVALPDDAKGKILETYFKSFSNPVRYDQ